MRRGDIAILIIICASTFILYRFFAFPARTTVLAVLVAAVAVGVRLYLARRSFR